MKAFPRALAVAGLAVIAGGIGQATWAQPAGPGGPGGPPAVMHTPGSGPHGPRGTPARFHGDPSARLEALRSEIGITPAQAAAWDAYTKVLRETGEQMRASMGQTSRLAFLEMTTQERLALLLKRREAREQAHANIKAAADALLAQLTDAQKVRALLTLPGLAGPGRFMGRHGHGHGHGPGMMPPPPAPTPAPRAN